MDIYVASLKCMQAINKHLVRDKNPCESLSSRCKNLLQCFVESEHTSKGVVEWSRSYPHDVCLPCATLQDDLHVHYHTCIHYKYI